MFCARTLVATVPPCDKQKPLQITNTMQQSSRRGAHMTAATDAHPMITLGTPPVPVTAIWT